jgi:hypothetical protein
MQYYGPFMERSFDAMTNYSPEQLEAVRDFVRDAAALAVDYAETLRDQNVSSEETEATG